MAEEDIHGFKVKYDEDSHTMRHAINHLKEKLDKSEVEPWFRDARHDLSSHSAHFEVHDTERNESRNVTLVHHSDGSYELKHRSHHS